MPERNTWLLPTSFALTLQVRRMAAPTSSMTIWMTEVIEIGFGFASEDAAKCGSRSGKVAENRDDQDTAEEDEHGAVELLGQGFPLQGLDIAVDVFFVLRILDELLEARIFLEVLAAAVAPEGGAEHAEARCGDGDREDLQNRVVIAGCRHEADDGDDRDGDRRCADAHLRRDGGYRHRPLGADVLLDGDIVR